jgi:hypothetical protein
MYSISGSPVSFTSFRTSSLNGTFPTGFDLGFWAVGCVPGPCSRSRTLSFAPPVVGAARAFAFVVLFPSGARCRVSGREYGVRTRGGGTDPSAPTHWSSQRVFPHDGVLARTNKGFAPCNRRVLVVERDFKRRLRVKLPRALLPRGLMALGQVLLVVLGSQHLAR